MKKAVILISGGLDSATALAMALDLDRDCFPLAFDYGQRHKRELKYAGRVVNHFMAEMLPCWSLKTVTLYGLDFPSALTWGQSVPKGREEAEAAKEVPVTYVPARNSVFLSIAAAFAEAIDADEIWTGFNDAADAKGVVAGYPDIKPDYVAAMEQALSLGSKRGREGRPIKLCTPLIHFDKATIIRHGMKLGVPFEHTWSCYEQGPEPCRACDACVMRANGFAAAELEDPA